MKKILIIILAGVFFPMLAQAQTLFYTDSIYTQPFARLQGSTSVNLGADTIWDDITVAIPIGFNFKIFNETTNTIYTDGTDGLNYGTILQTKPSFFSPYPCYLIPSTIDLLNRDSTKLVSPITYKLTGTAPNRIFKLEFRNCGIYDGLATDSIDIQTWLYETSNIIEYRYGNVNLQTDPTLLFGLTNGAGDFAGIIDSLNIDTVNNALSAGKAYYMQGNPLAPTFDSIANLNLSNNFPGMDSAFASNMVYRIKPIVPIIIPAGINATAMQSKVQIGYANNILSINNNSNPIDAILFNTNGSAIRKITCPTGVNNFEFSYLVNGIYYLQLGNGRSKEVFKFVKQ